MKNFLCITLLGALFAGPVLIQAKNDKAPGASLDGYRFQFPCKGKMPDKPKKGTVHRESGRIRLSSAALAPK
jgi:hypothetical protein